MTSKLLTALLGFASSAYAVETAVDMSQFQAFDNQVSVGYGYNSSTLSNPNNSYIQQTSNNQSINLNVEHLFDNHVWFDVNGSFTFSTSQSGTNLGFLNNVQNLAFPASLTGKVGYSFPIAQAPGLQLIPYATTGRVLNYNGVTVPSVGFTNSYYNLYGFGGRAEYVVNDSLMVYFDQAMGYLDDQSGAPVNLSAWTYNSALGLKYNMTPTFQLGIQGTYNQTNVASSTAGYDSVTYTSRNVYQSSVGGLFSLGYAYDGRGAKTSLWADDYANGGFSYFDNVFSLGYGYAQSNTSGSGSYQGIATSINYIDLNVQRLFLSGIWVDLDGQLITSITQSNTSASPYNDYAPTYLAYPGSATVSLGYAVPVVRDMVQVIPYLNGGLVMNVNSYTITQNQSISSQLSRDTYYQYGGGAKVEYMLNKQFQFYFNQLFAGLSDQSGLGLGLWRSTSTLGSQYNVYGPLQLGLGLYYDQLSPTGSPSASISQPVFLNQSTVGGLFSVGLRY